MPTKDESTQKQHVHTQKEHAQWLEKLHGWRAEHQRALAKLAHLQASMMEHDADIEEHLGHIHRHEQLIERHERQIAANKVAGNKTNGSSLDEDVTDGHSDLDMKHRKLRADIKRMDKAHSETVGALSETIDKLEEIRGRLESSAREQSSEYTGEQTRDHRGHEGIDEDELVHEASEESFPASDPPSFNPGRT